MSWTLSNICNLPENYFKPQCNCINPPSTIRNVAANMLAPYYCWYAPCLASNAIKSPEIIQGQLDCKITNCSISISEIKVTGGIITIDNKCAKDIISVLNSRNINVSLERVEFSTQIPAFPYRVLILLISSAFLLL